LLLVFFQSSKHSKQNTAVHLPHVHPQKVTIEGSQQQNPHSLFSITAHFNEACEATKTVCSCETQSDILIQETLMQSLLFTTTQKAVKLTTWRGTLVAPEVDFKTVLT
jgi:hypothetical protein